jgi:murein L,D-transpeptidase YafK
MKKIFLLASFLCLMFSYAVFSQGSSDLTSFKSYQLSMPRVSQAYGFFNDMLKKEFEAKGLAYPPIDLYIRSFKSQNEMEVWVKNPDVDTYSFFKTYKVCALSGSLGPKRWEGDRQVPEGLYFINHFNPKSDFHLSMLVSYPNYSDLVLGNKTKPGGDIYIHGACYTVGCLPMTDNVIKELYVLCLAARFQGQNNIPIHIFPTRFNKVSVGFLAKEYGNDEDKHRFWLNLKAGYDYFEAHKKILPVMYTKEGKYVF